MCVMYILYIYTSYTLYILDGYRIAPLSILLQCIIILYIYTSSTDVTTMYYVHLRWMEHRERTNGWISGWGEVWSTVQSHFQQNTFSSILQCTVFYIITHSIIDYYAHVFKVLYRVLHTVS